jgi:hypothetical protein
MRRWLARLAAAALGALALACAGLSWSLTAELWIRVPFADAWVFYKQLPWSDGWPTSAHLFAFHNEHWIVLPRLILFADLWLARGSGALAIVATQAIQVAHALLWCWAFRRWSGWQGSKLLAAYALVWAVLFHPGQLENFIAPFQVQIPLVAMFISAAMVSFADGRWRISVGCAWLGCASFGSGVLILPVLVVLAFWQSRKEARWLALAALPPIVGYAVFGTRTGGPLQPFEALRYALTLMGNVDWILGPRAVVLVALALMGVTVVSLRRTAGPLAVSLAGLSAVVLTSCVLTASGRAHLGWFQATSSRYQTMTLLLWLAAGGLAALGPARWAVWFVAAGLTVPLTMLPHAAGAPLHLSRLMRGPEIVLLAGGEDPEILRAMDVDFQEVIHAVRWMESNSVNVFSAPERRLLREQFQPKVSGACEGFAADGTSGLIAFHPAKPGMRTSGTWKGSWRRRLIVTSNGLVVGFGYGSMESWTAWNHIRPGAANAYGSYSIWGANGDGTYCAVAQRGLGFGQPPPDVWTAPGVQRNNRVYTDGDGDFRFGPKHDQMITFPEGGGRIVRFGSGVAWVEGSSWLVGQPGRWLDGAVGRRFEGVPGMAAIPIAGRWNGPDPNGDFDTVEPVKPGYFLDGQWFLDTDGDFRITKMDRVFQFGARGDLPVVGDWAGNRRTCVGTFRDGVWRLDKDCDGRWDPAKDEERRFGQAGDLPVVGIWMGEGVDQVGVFRKGEWLLDLNFDGSPDFRSRFGEAGDIPLMGPWRNYDHWAQGPRTDY